MRHHHFGSLTALRVTLGASPSVASLDGAGNTLTEIALLTPVTVLSLQEALERLENKYAE